MFWHSALSGVSSTTPGACLGTEVYFIGSVVYFIVPHIGGSFGQQHDASTNPVTDSVTADKRFLLKNWFIGCTAPEQFCAVDCCFTFGQELSSNEGRCPVFLLGLSAQCPVTEGE